MQIIYKGTPNKQPRTGKVKLVVIHWFGLGTLESANTRFQNIANQVSAHYGVDGIRVWQWAKENEVAYHCGNLQCNKDSIGIEHNATTTQPASDITYNTSIELIAGICQRHGITPSSDTIKPHKAFKATACPGTLNLTRIIDGVKAKLQNGGMDEEKELYKVWVADGLNFKLKGKPEIYSWFKWHDVHQFRDIAKQTAKGFTEVDHSVNIVELNDMITSLKSQNSAMEAQIRELEQATPQIDTVDSELTKALTNFIKKVEEE